MLGFHIHNILKSFIFPKLPPTRVERCIQKTQSPSPLPPPSHQHELKPEFDWNANAQIPSLSVLWDDNRSSFIELLRQNPMEYSP
mmetsp:Transcript_52844/g.78364  ORF Transcript_52844/g.78364 Transcript_52844/m.78364 type:complete len:85 (-) Transcript_52844:365-619(-)